jgi:hypothetical protein
MIDITPEYLNSLDDQQAYEIFKKEMQLFIQQKEEHKNLFFDIDEIVGYTKAITEDDEESGNKIGDIVIIPDKLVLKLFNHKKIIYYRKIIKSSIKS